MELLRTSSQIIEKIITNRDGVRARVIFAISEHEGTLKVQVISVTPIAAERPITFLPEKCHTALESCALSLVGTVRTSPYYSIDILTFQKTRAPNRASSHW